MSYAAPDGYQRKPEEEFEINQLAAKLLDSDDGRCLMQYLESITVKTVVPPTAEPHQFAYMEGRRDLFRVLQNRVEHGNAGLPKEIPNG
jgi:hypothetical protein